MRPEDFLTDVEAPDGLPMHVPNFELLGALRRAPILGVDDLDAATALASLLHDDLQRYGTGGGEQLTNEAVALGLRSLRVTLGRLGIQFEPEWRDFPSFRSYWIKNGAYGSWQARRDLLNAVFEPIHVELQERQDRAEESRLADPVSPRERTGWPKVDEEIQELRRRFRSSSTAQDYRAIGTHCVGVLEALSRTVYDRNKHLREGEEEPAPDKTKQRLGRYIETALPGAHNEPLRGIAVKTIELAHQVKHRETPTRQDAGIAADAVILLANILRRLS